MENRKISHFIQALWHPYGAWKWPFLTKWEIHCLPHYPHMGPFQKNSHLVRVWPRKNGKKREEMHENIKTKLRNFFLPFFWLNVTAIMLGLTSIPQNIFTYLLMKNKQHSLQSFILVPYALIKKKPSSLSVDNYRLVIFSLQLVLTKNLSSC